MYRLCCLSLMLVPPALAGCHRAPPPKDPAPQPAIGKVIDLDGQPLREGVVFLTTTDPSYLAKAEIRADGTFQLATQADAAKEVVGVPAGGYMVRVKREPDGPNLKLKQNSLSIKKGQNDLVIEVAP